jgi:adenosine deaminase
VRQRSCRFAVEDFSSLVIPSEARNLHLNAADITAAIRTLPKAELHLHLEGSIRPDTAVELAARHGVALTEQDAELRYRYTDFSGFLDAFKWVTAFLRQPADYALVTRRLAEELLAQDVVYAEVTVALGVLLWRNQQPDPVFDAIWGVAQEFEPRGLTLRWIPDGTWQFGAEAAVGAARAAVRAKDRGVIAFGMGGDEMAIPFLEFRAAYEIAAAAALHRVAHAGEVGPPQHIRDAVELLGAERIGHGIATMHDPALAELLTARRIPLEVCPVSNACTGALAKQLGKPSATLAEHPLKRFVESGVPVTLSTDDPAMFHTDLLSEYAGCATQMGFSIAELVRLAEASFEYAFLPALQKRARLADFRSKAKESRLL